MSRREDLTAIVRGKCISDAATEAAVDALMEYLAVPCGHGCAEPCHPDEHAREVESPTTGFKAPLTLLNAAPVQRRAARKIWKRRLSEASDRRDLALWVEAVETAVRERDEARRETDALRDRLAEFATYCHWMADQPGGTKRPGWLHMAGRVDDILRPEVTR